MIFNSLEYTLFLPIIYLIYLAIYKQQTKRDVFLLLASYFFYMSWYWQYAGLIALSTCVDYIIGRKLHKESVQSKRKLLLICSITLNIGMLCLFKYWNFFNQTSQSMLQLLGISIDPVVHNLLLPVGISFYTFQTLSYTIDLYRKKIDYEPNVIKFAVFVSFFPQLVAGPIVRAKDFLPQINLPNLKPTSAMLKAGSLLILIGLVKKIVFADILAYLVVDKVFAAPHLFSSFDLLLALYAYSFQIYFDFSGYSDIAIGTALILGFNLPINFNRPYIASSPSDFWKRWHISLSSWIRDYVYISLGGNRVGKSRLMFNLLLTMGLAGLWHGAGINFILWGLYHGLLLVIFNSWQTEAISNIKKIIRIIVTYHLVLVGWLMFRSQDFGLLKDYVSGLLDLSVGTQFSLFFYMVLFAAAILHFTPRSWLQYAYESFYLRRAYIIQAGIYAGAIIVFFGFTLGAPAFIYFQF